MTTETNQITLTAEQLINIVGHAATQEQLDNVRRELDTKIERVGSELNAKIDNATSELNSKIDRVGHELNTKIDRVGHELNTKIDRVDGKIDALKNWMLGMGFTVLLAAVAATSFIVSRLPPLPN